MNQISKNEQAQNSQLAKEIAETILTQIGGRRFLRMTGAKDLLIMDCQKPFGLRMKLPTNKSGANYLYILLEDDDTYTLKFQYKKMDKKTLDVKIEDKAVETMVYAEDLERFFTSVTGLYTRL